MSGKQQTICIFKAGRVFLFPETRTDQFNSQKRKVVRKHSWHCFAQALNKYQKRKEADKSFFQFCLIESVEGTKIFIKSRLGGLGYVLLGYVKKKRQKKYNHVSTVTWLAGGIVSEVLFVHQKGICWNVCINTHFYQTYENHRFLQFHHFSELLVKVYVTTSKI